MSVKINIKLLSIIVMISSIFCSCEYDHPVPIEVDQGVVSYSSQIQPIFDASCNGAGCHSTGAILPDLTNANSYNSLFANNMIDSLNPENSALYVSITTGSMKPYLANSVDAAYILKWIQQGAENN